MTAANTFESLVDDLSAATFAPAWVAFLTGFYGARLNARLATESTAYTPVPGAHNALLHSAYTTGDLVHGSDAAVALGGGR
jgi:hypothetical protein